MNWSIIGLNFGVICLSVSTVLCAYQVRKLQRRVSDLEYYCSLRDAQDGFIRNMNEIQAKQAKYYTYTDSTSSITGCH
jgi:hypothetical protein